MRVAEGESVLITNGGVPAVVMVPAGADARARLVADAIHLVAAMELGEIDFLTYDRRQAQAAAERGFTIVAPGRPEGWYGRPVTES